MELPKKLNITDWAEEDRPREKLLAKGIGSLSDAELIAILIGSGNRDETAVELSKRILSSSKNNLNELGKLSIAELIKFKGIGEAKAISIIAALELGKRRKSSEVIDKQIIQGSEDVYQIFHSILCDLTNEEFWILLLNKANKIIEKIKISGGGTSSTIVDVKIVAKNALEKLASSIILCHNHPSGRVEPSNEDIQITNQIKKAVSFFDIQLLDHIIVGDKNYYSFADEGII